MLKLATLHLGPCHTHITQPQRATHRCPHGPQSLTCPGNAVSTWVTAVVRMCVCTCTHTHTHTHTNGLAHPLCEEVLGQSKSLPHSFCLTFTITLGGRSCWDSLAPFEKMRKIKPSKKQNLSVVSPRVISGRGKKGCKGSLVTPGPGCVPGRSELLKQASSPQEQ